MTRKTRCESLPSNTSGHSLATPGLTRLENRTLTFTNIHSLARDLANKYHGVALSSEMLANTNGTAGLPSKIVELNPSINVPLPWSNSPLAKQMRVAFFLAILACELCTHIFQPTYILKDAAALNKVLAALAKEEPELEIHLRSVLLLAGDTLRKRKQKEPVDEACINTRINTVVENVYNRSCPLVHQDKQTAYKTDLRELCTSICQHWRFIQTLEDRCVADLGSNKTSRLRKWKPLAFETPPPQPGPPSSSSTKTRANGTASTGNNHKNPPSPPTQQPNGIISNADLFDEGIPIWPAFYNLSAEDEPTWAEGLVLPQALKKAARAEETAILESETAALKSGPARAARGERRRRPSVLMPMVQGNGSPAGSSSFLSSSSGGGRRGA